MTPPNTILPDISGLPGEDLVRKGIADLSNDSHGTLEALLLHIYSHRLQTAGISIPPAPPLVADHHTQLSASVNEHTTYNAALQRISSFLDALESRLARTQHAA